MHFGVKSSNSTKMDPFDNDFGMQNTLRYNHIIYQYRQSYLRHECIYF